MAGFGLQELFILWMIVAMLVVFGGWPAWRIFSKAGFPGWPGLLMLVPVVNYLVFLFLAFAEWPVHRELKRLQPGGTGPGPMDH